MALGADDYYDGALRNLSDAQCLRDALSHIREEHWVGAVYLAGRAVECLLRSLLWLRTGEQQIGHDLRDLLKRVRSLGMLGAEDEQLEDEINNIAVVWHNNLRYFGPRRFRADLVKSGRVYRIGRLPVKGDPLKANAMSVADSCEAVISRGALVWKRSRTSS